MESNTTPETPVWMKDPLVSDIDVNKLQFLQTMVFETKGKSGKELMPILMNMVKQGKTKQISFSDEEMSAIVTAIRKYSTPEELIQINKFMEMHAQRKKKAPTK